MKIASRINALTITAVSMTALAIGAILFSGFRSLITQQQENSVERHVFSESQRLTLALRELSNDVQLLATLPLVQFIAAESADPKVPGLAESFKAQLADVFTEMLRSKPYYAQIRLIGAADQGLELVRVHRSDVSIVRVSGDELQQKADRRYFQSAIAQKPGQLFLSQISLNREHGRVQEPHQPVLRAAIRVDTKTAAPYGVVVINLDFKRFVDLQFADSDRLYTNLMTNSTGDYLLHPDQSKTFGFDLGTPRVAQADFPEIAPLFTSNAEKATSLIRNPSTDETELVHFRKVRIFPDNPDRFLTLGVAASQAELVAGANAIFRQAMYATFGLVIVMLIAAVVATRLLAKPLEQITRAAGSLSRGDVVTDLPTKRRDEIGVLARSFDQMAVSLQKKEAELVDANRRLSASNDDLEHFVHIAAHDLREPLRKQRNFADLLRFEHADKFTNGGGEYLDSISQCSMQMQEMIDAFRELTKLGYGNPVRETISIKTVIESCLADVAPELAHRRVDIRWDAFPDEFGAYPALVKQLYSNLIGNALEHVNGDGFEIRLEASRSDRGWEFGVCNTGSCISADQCTEIFQILRKADLTSSEGTGVGLSICKKIVERHRGTITVDSTQDTVNFRFTLGAQDDQDHQ